MGFPKNWCEIAYDVCEGNIEESIQWILAHSEELEASKNEEEDANDKMTDIEEEEEEEEDEDEMNEDDDDMDDDMQQQIDGEDKTNSEA